MSRITTLLLFIYLNMGLSYGMQCSVGNKNFLSRMINSCPGLLDSADKSYCCIDIERSEMYCCDGVEFAIKSSGILLAVIATVVIVVVFCVSCFCCTCCPWYRRRHRGTVYGQMQYPNVVHVIQSPANVPQPTPHAANPGYPTNSAGVVQPPSYNDVMYEKQAPYNPNYVSSTYQYH